MPDVTESPESHQPRRSAEEPWRRQDKKARERDRERDRERGIGTELFSKEPAGLYRTQDRWNTVSLCDVNMSRQQMTGMTNYQSLPGHDG